MDIKQLLDNDRGVSPVIGVILMVAITVILAAVIGTFVLGLGSQVGNQAPQATFEYSYSNFGDSDYANDTIKITHQSGQSIQVSSLNVSVGGSTLYSGGSLTSAADVSNTSETEIASPSGAWTSGTISAGNTLTLAENSSWPGETNSVFGNDETVRVVWMSDSGSSSIISTSTTPR